MKKLLFWIAVILLVFAFSACAKRSDADETRTQDTMNGEENSADQSQAGTVTLTRELLDRYLETLPPFAHKAKEIGDNVNTIGAAQLGGGELVALLQAHGWDDPELFMDVHAKIWTLVP